MIIENLFKPTVVEGSAANDYFTRRKSEEERIAGTRPPAKNKNNPADTDYSKRRAREKKVDQGVAEGLGKDIKRLATGKDVKSRAGQEIAKSQDASMKGDTKTSKKHFDRYDKLDKLANKTPNKKSSRWNHNDISDVIGDMFDEGKGVAEGAPIVVMPRADRLKKPEPTKVRYQGDIVPPTKPPSTEKRGVKGRLGQRPMPKYDVEEAKKKGISEGRVKELITDLRKLTDAEFQAQYKMTKAEARAGLSGKNESVAEARMSAAQRLSMAWDKQRAKSDASLRRTPSSIPKSTPEPKKTDTGPKTVSESRVKRRALMAQMLNSH